MSLSIALSYCTFVYLLLHDAQVAQQHAEASISLAAKQGFTLRLAIGTYYRGLALVSQGNQEGIKQMQLGLKAIQATGSEHVTPYYLAGLAEGHANADQKKQAL